MSIFNDMFGCGECERLWGEITELKRETHCRANTCREVEQILGEALGYPDYPKGSGSVCIGEHVTETIAAEAAKRIAQLEWALRRTYTLLPPERVHLAEEATAILEKLPE